MPVQSEYFGYIPNTITAGHRGDREVEQPHSLEYLTRHARLLEQHGWKGALLGAGWGRPDAFTVATALAVRTEHFEPLIAIRPGYWQPAQFAAAAATLDQLVDGRIRINIVSGQDDPTAYGDGETDQAHRYARTAEFMQLLRQLWTRQQVNFRGQYFQLSNSTAQPRLPLRGQRAHPLLYFGGASAAAERVAATEADVQLFWGEPLDGIATRIARLKALSVSLGRKLPPLQFGLRITTLLRNSTEQAWTDAQAKVATMRQQQGVGWQDHRGPVAHGQQRLLDLHARGTVLDTCLYTAPGAVGGGGAGSTWLVGSAQDLARALRNYEALGISHFILSDTPYLDEVVRQGDQLLPLLRGP